MNLKTTLALALLLVAGGASWFLLTRSRPAETAGETLIVLETELTPARLTRIEIKRGDRHVVLERAGGGEWSLPGKWPVRKPEVEELVHTLTTLRSRFEPIPLGNPPELKEYGLDRNPLVVKVKAGGKDYELTLGEKSEGGNRFSQPTYLRLGASTEAVRLAPNLLAVLDRPQDYYQQRRLFPAERVAKEGDSGEKVELLLAKKVAVTGRETGYSLEQTVDGWRLRDLVRDAAAPTKFTPGAVDDRPDPEKLNRLRTALPDVWVERFVPAGEKKKELGLEKPEQTVQVTRPGGDTLTLLVGAVSQTKVRKERKPSFDPRIKPPETMVFESYHYARLKDNDQVFEIRGNWLKDVAVSVTELRDPQLARFRPGDARRVEVEEGGRRLVFVHDKGGWRMEKPAAVEAETGKVTELLDKLSGLEARAKDVLDKVDPKAYGLDKPAVVKIALEETKEGDKGGKARAVTFLLGKQADKDRLYVQVAGTGRVNAVDDAVLKLVRRPALAYRSRRLFDVPTSALTKIEVQRDGDPLTLAQVKSAWRLTAPVQAEADAGKAESLAGEVARLEASEFVADNASPEDLDKIYGLTKPAATVTVTFADAKKPARALKLGKQQPGKQEFFARLDDDPTVFAVKKETRDALERPSLAYRRLELWRLRADDIAEVRVQKAGPEYRLQRGGDGWKLSGPFEATVPPGQAEALAGALAEVRAEKYVAHDSKDLEKYGLDKPYLRIAVREGAPKKDEGKKGAAEAKEHVLLIGGKADKDGRYAKLGSGEGVFVLGDKVVAAVDHNATDLLDRKLLALNERDIRRIRTTRADGQSFTLEHQGGAWRVVQAPPASFVPDADTLDESLFAWSSLRALRFAAYGSKVDAALFGLDKPAVTVQLTVQELGEKDKPGKTSEHTLALGKAVEGAKGERYARLDKGPGVVVLDERAAKALDRTHLDFVSHALFKFDADRLTALKRVGGGDPLEVVKKDGQWRLLKPAEQPADARTLEALSRQLAGLRAEKVAAYPAKDLGPFGLDKPAAVLTVRVTDAAGKPADHVLNLGSPAEEKGDRKGGLRYARVGKSDTVVVVRTRLAVDLLGPALQFRDRNLARVETPDRVVLERDGRKVTFTRVEDTWKMTAPVEANAESADLEAFVKELTQLRADEVVANRAVDPKTYGLDRPRARWRLLAREKELLTLLVGATAQEQDRKAGGRAYAKLAAGELVFLLNPSLTDRALAEYRSRKFWAPLDAVQIDRITYRSPKELFTLQKVDGAWEVAGKAGTKANADAVRDVLDALASLQAERYVADRGGELKLYGLEPPALALEIQTPDGKRTLNFGRQEGGSARRYATVPGASGSVFVISEATARRLLRPGQEFTAKPRPSPESVDRP